MLHKLNTILGECTLLIEPRESVHEYAGGGQPVFGIIDAGMEISGGEEGERGRS